MMATNPNSFLYDLVDEKTIDNFPHTLLLVGETGSGRKTLATYIAKKFGLELLDITDNIDQDWIDAIRVDSTLRVFLVDLDKISTKNETALLKIFEEPPKNVLIVCLCQDAYDILPTIKSRCIEWDFEPYDKEYLKSVLSTNNYSESLFYVANTPGRVLKYCTYPIDDMFALAQKVLTKIRVANVANTLSLTNKLAFNDEKDKYDVELFARVLLLVCAKLYLFGNDNTINAYAMYKPTLNLIKNLEVPNVDKKAVFERYLMELRET